MGLKYPTIRVRMAFTRARAVLYEDYLAVENLHSFGMTSEDSRTYYDEIRWVLKFEKRDWYRAGHAFIACFPLMIGVLLLVFSEDWIASAFGMAFTLPSALWFVYSIYRLIVIPRGVAAVVSSRGTVTIGVDWPKSGNRLKDAPAFFETLLGRLKLVAAMPPPPAPPAPAVIPVEGAMADSPQAPAIVPAEGAIPATPPISAPAESKPPAPQT